MATRVSAHSTGTVAPYCHWTQGELCSRLDEECNCTCKKGCGKERTAKFTLSFGFSRGKHTVRMHIEQSRPSSNTYTHIL